VIDTAPAAKLDAIPRLGAEIVKAPFDECWRALGERHHHAMTGTFVHPFEDDAFIAGNGTAGLEILEDLPDVDAVMAWLHLGPAVAICGSRSRTMWPVVVHPRYVVGRIS
jgi:threonine dehydratase